jgi:endoglucanase Acf2
MKHATFPRWLAPANWLASVLLTLHSASFAEEIVKTGAGSYTTRRPPSCKPLPETLYRTAAATGPVPTNQWWSSLVWKPFSQNLFPHPLGMVCLPEGLAVAYPGASVTGGGGHIMGSAIGAGDFVIGHSGVNSFRQSDFDGASDWFIDVRLAEGEKQLRLSFGHGSPFVFARHAGGDPVVRFQGAPEIWSGHEGDAILGVIAGGQPYALFGPTGSHWTGTAGDTFTLTGGRDYFSIALLPDKESATLERFAAYAHSHVTDTRVIPRVEAGRVITEYRFDTNAMEGSRSGTLFALYPHQWKYTADPLTPWAYRSVRGTMKVGEGDSFKTSVPVQGVLPHLPSEGIADRDATLGLLRNEVEQPPAAFTDTYWEGKHLGKLANLAGVAEAAGDEALRSAFLKEIRRRLENWFTASPGEDFPLFYHDSKWGALVGSKPSYGSDVPLNDHHFHYGYFIRAAAEVARHDPSWAGNWGPMVELLIRDIASPDPADPMFPRLRCFDRYAGHSWASGNADFADGNNQESSSESMNAWYGLMLWGAATGNEALRDLGVFLYNTERTAIEEYWFDISGTNYPEDFPHVALGMVWGGKGAFGTWFSGEIDCIHGINWLPFTPASIYLGRDPAYVKVNHDRLVSERKDGSDYGTGWGDLVLMFRALAEPREAAAWFTAHPEMKLEGGNTRPFMSQWLHTLDRLGVNDPSVVADTPFFNVFIRDGSRTHAVYNHESLARTVRFSDGTVITAKPSSLTVVPSKP